MNIARWSLLLLQGFSTRQTRMVEMFNTDVQTSTEIGFFGCAVFFKDHRVAASAYGPILLPSAKQAATLALARAQMTASYRESRA